jgi:hypothetical protein
MYLESLCDMGPAGKPMSLCRYFSPCIAWFGLRAGLPSTASKGSTDRLLASEGGHHVEGAMAMIHENALHNAENGNLQEMDSMSKFHIAKERVSYEENKSQQCQNMKIESASYGKLKPHLFPKHP